MITAAQLKLSCLRARHNTGRTWLISSAAVLAQLFVIMDVYGAEEDSFASQPEQIAPGIWRLHFGNPESFTPVHFRSAEMDATGLQKMPFNEPMPLDTKEVSFEVSERGCSVQLPMKPGENIYGFGLHTE